MNTLSAATDDIGAINTSALSKAQHVLDLASTTTRSIQAVAESTEALTGSASHISAQVDEQARMGAAAMAASDSGQLSLQALSEQADNVSRSEEHTSELQSLMRISYAVFCLKKKKKHKRLHQHIQNI